MIVEYIRYNIEPSRQEAFLGAYEIASKSLRESAHCLGYELTQCTEARESFVLRIEWTPRKDTSRASGRARCSSPSSPRCSRS